MKQFSTFLGLHARSTLGPAAVLMAVMAAAETGLYLYTAQTHAAADDGGLASPQLLMQNSGILWCCAAAFLLVTALLCLDGCSFGTQNRCTLGRLRISEKRQILFQALYNALVYLLFAAVQVALGFIFCRWTCTRLEGQMLAGQLTMLTFYQNRLLHAFLPLADSGVWLRNLAVFAALSFVTAFFPYQHRRKRFDFSIILLAAAAVFLFPTDGNSVGMLIALGGGALLLLLIDLYAVFGADGGEEHA